MGEVPHSMGVSFPREGEQGIPGSQGAVCLGDGSQQHSGVSGTERSEGHSSLRSYNCRALSYQ